MNFWNRIYSVFSLDFFRNIWIMDSINNLTQLTKKEKPMSNYTEKMVAELRAATPLNLEKAKAFASDWGLSHRSIISKAKSLGLDYESQPKRVASKRVGPTKADLLDGIRKALTLPDREGDLTKAELESVLEHLA